MNLMKKYEDVRQIILSDRFSSMTKLSEIKVNRADKYRKPSVAAVDRQQKSFAIVDSQQKSFVVVDFQQKSFVADQQQKSFAAIFALMSFEQKFAVIISLKPISNNRKFFANSSASASKLLINNSHFNQFMTIVRRSSRFE